MINRKNWTMRTTLTERMCALATLCLTAATPVVAVHQIEGETLRFYGSKASPCLEIELYEADVIGHPGKAEDAPCALALKFLTPDRSRVAATFRQAFEDSFSVQRPNGNGFDISGRLPIEGGVHVFRASLSPDRGKLEWIAPAKITLADGRTFSLAGRYTELDDKARNAAAKAAFEKIDAELNGIYARVKEKLDESAFAQVRDSQRAWLKYRDRPFIADYDGEVVQNGPGSATHFRGLGHETAARIAYLKPILEPAAEGARNGLYSDGIDRTVRVRFMDDILTFTVDIQYQPWHVKEIFDWHGSITGCARPEGGGRVWSADAKGIEGGGQESVIPGRLRFSFAADGTLVLELPSPDDAAGQAGALYGGKFRRVRALEPAEDSLRHWLTLLPEQAFEATADPLTRKDAQDLARTGSGGQGFTVAGEGANHLLMKHPDGEVALARFAREDGGLVVGVEQTNGRNRELDFWEWNAVEKMFQAWDARLPKPDPEEFFQRPLKDSEAEAARKQCAVLHSLHRGDWGGVEIRLEPGMPYEGTSPDYSIDLNWNGWRLGGVQKIETE